MATGKASSVFRIGFLALSDAAPLLVAQEQGFFARRGVRVELCREVGWATIRDKVLFGELDAAQAPAPMLWSAALGLGGAAADVCTAFVLNLHGNAITLSQRLWDEGVRDDATLRAAARQRRGENRLTFGIVHPFSTHHLQLRHYLARARIDVERDVRIAVVPPAQMFRNLVAGTLDGYCAGEPWNTLAVQEGEGWCPAWSAVLSPGHVEKVLLVRSQLAESRAEEHAAVIAALHDAAVWCDAPAHRALLPDLLAGPRQLGVAARVLAPAFTGQFSSRRGSVETAPDFLIFHAGNANVPTVARAANLQAELIAAGLVPRDAASATLPETLFREDLYSHALSSLTHAHRQKPARSGAFVPA